MTRGDLRARVLRGLNESATAPVFWSADEMNAVLDEALEVLAEESGGVKRTAFLALKARVTYYSIAAIAPDLMSPYRIWHHDQSRRLDATTLTNLDARHETWATVTGDPVVWCPLSWDTFGVWPTPASDGGVLRVDYLAWPRSLMDDEDEPEFPEADHDAVTLYGVYDGLCKRWDAKAAIATWGMFMQPWGASRARTGAGRVQSRIHQRAEQDGLGLGLGAV